MNRDDLIDELLQKTSRTFALAIPLLPEPDRKHVGVGYLLFRIADTLEDAERLGRDARLAALQSWIDLLSAPSPAAAEAFAAIHTANPPSTNEDYNLLVGKTPEVFARFFSFDPEVRHAISRHAIRSARGMAETLQAADDDGAFELQTLAQLQQYCYYVAGIVGEMLTDLFTLRLPESAARDALAGDAAAFGEGLQLVNILKDAGSDARDGRTYLPSDATRGQVMQQAREDLQAAERYTGCLAAAGADGGVVAFTTLPRTLAEATLDRLEQGEVKVTRDVVTEKLAQAEAIRTGQGG